MKREDALARVVANTVKACVPFVVHLELTGRCNLNCRHCYLGRSRYRELRSSQWDRVFEKLKGLGCLFAAVSGGEVFLRKDLFEILEALRARGLALRVLSNGTLIGPSEAKSLARLSPASVEISLLGGRAKTHDSISRSEGSFDRASKAIELLLSEGVRTIVKLPVMRANWREFESIEAFAQRLGAKLRYDICIAPRCDGDRSPLEERLDPKELRSFLLSRLADTAPDYLLDVPSDAPPCGAGHNAFSIAPDGVVHPCTALRLPLGNILSDGWEKIVQSPELLKLRKLRVGDLQECSQCPYLPLCGRCPGVALIETGSFDGPSPSACRLGRELYSICYGKVPGK